MAPLLAKRDVRPRPDWISGFALEGFPSLPFLSYLAELLIRSLSHSVCWSWYKIKIKTKFQEQDQTCLTLLINSLIILISVKSKQPTL